MTSQDTTRRLAILTGYSSLADLSESDAMRMLDASLSYFLAFTHRVSDPGEVIDNLIVDIAKSRIARDGQEGVKQAKDGSMMRVYDDGGLSPDVLAELKAWRVIAGVSRASYES